MPKTTRLSEDVEHLRAVLDRIGVLLVHDAGLASATSIIAGAPVAGSWWGHPEGRRMYEALSLFDEGDGALCAKLVNGKLSYVARRLWPTFLLLANRLASALPPLPAGAETLLARLGAEPLRVDSLDPDEFGGKRQVTECVRAIGSNLLANIESVHTASGKHQKQLRSWTAWAGLHAVRPASSADGLRTALDTLQAEGTGRVRSPFDVLLGRG